MSIEKSIFIIGSGRSGTTILYEILAAHPELAWFSMASNMHPGSRSWARLNRVLDYPWIGKYLKKRIITPTRFSPALTYLFMPNEGADIYRAYGFSDERQMTEDDYDAELERKLKGDIEMHLEVTGKPRFINKRTANTQRLRLMNRMFPEAYYVHMVRDGRAVINSYLKVDFWKDMTVWWLGKKVSEWERDGKDPVELAAKHWRRNFEEILTNRSLFKHYMEVRYEDFVKEPGKEIHRITDFCEISFPDNYQAIIPATLPNMNYKWKQGLTAKQIEVIEKNTRDLLEQLGYMNNS